MRLDLKSAIKRHGVTQSSVANAVGISHGYMSGLCAGTKSPSNDILIRIAAHLDVTPNDLYDLDDEIPSLPATAPHAQGELKSVPLSAHQLAAATTLFPELESGVGYRSNVELPRFLISKGDLLVVDRKCDPEAGDLVVIAGPPWRIARNIGTTCAKLIDHEWNDITPTGDDAKCRPVVAVLRARRPNVK